MTYEEVDMLRSALYNLSLIKVAVDNGVDKRKFGRYFFDPGYESDPAQDIFYTAISDIFEMCEWFYPYDNTEEENKEYWISQTSSNLTLEDIGRLGVVVILDDRFDTSTLKVKHLNGESDYTMYYGDADIHPIERGIVIIYDEDYGMMDVVQVLLEIVEYIKGEKENGVAIINIRRAG